nr:translin [Danaus plexippus plexippus]
MSFILTRYIAVHNRKLIPVLPACQKARELFEKANEGYQRLKTAVPATDFYKYHDHWRFTTQRYCFLISLTIWLETGILATHETVASILGGNVLLLAVNSQLGVKPSKRLGSIGTVKSYNHGILYVCIFYRLLNLKNDHLRKRFDALKYDVKKIEEVVYDLSIRGLLAKNEDAS